MDVFVYGTLTDLERVGQVLSEYAFRGPAAMEGLRRVEGTYPTLVPGGRTEGRLLRTAEIERLDRYEGVDRGLYTRVAVPVADEPTGTDEPTERTEPTGASDRRGADGPNTVAVYIGDPAALGVREAEARWPGEEAFPARVERYVRDRRVYVERE